MLLKRIVLEQIRSYTHADISFSDGIVLLAGDIGSGKSSILLGIEFALFGTKTTELPATTLLRHGAKEGAVVLYFELGGNEIIIKRTLKRGKQGIKQDTGYIIINGTKKELSPVEMKAEVFEMLGYPKELISKNKDLIYRYTVYTPQEEMKRILFEQKETRLDTLRKVFNIDKYKRIKENAAITLRSIRENSRELAGFISDLEAKKKQMDDNRTEIASLTEQQAKITPLIQEAKDSVAVKETLVTKQEAHMRELTTYKQKYNIAETNLQHAISQRAKGKEDLERLEIQIASIQNEIGTETIVDATTVSNQINEHTIKKTQLQNELEQSSKKVFECEHIIKTSEQLITKIKGLEECPMCLQQVGNEHKESIGQVEQDKVLQHTAELDRHQAQQSSTKTEITKIDELITGLQKQQQTIALQELKQKNLVEKKKELETLQLSMDSLKKNIGEINTEKMAVQQKIETLQHSETLYQAAKKELDETREVLQKRAVEFARIESSLEAAQKTLQQIETEILEKEKAKQKLLDHQQIQQWLSDFFVKLMDTMERHVMVHVHREFNELFQEWFSLLISDETISVRIDDSFTPIVEQNGYDTAVDNLSGGEKTAVALAYRLSLNKVINDVVSGIQTKDILMLDEPTDGFSTEQLDKVRDILNQLQMKQVLIVSHEAKIESFVDSIIKIGKTGHESEVV